MGIVMAAEIGIMWMLKHSTISQGDMIVVVALSRVLAISVTMM